MKMAVLFLTVAIISLSAADLTGAWEVSLSGGQLNEARRVNITSESGQYKWKFFGSQFSGMAQGDTAEFHCVEDSKPCGSLKGH
jgi:hypothetical protein